MELEKFHLPLRYRHRHVGRAMTLRLIDAISVVYSLNDDGQTVFKITRFAFADETAEALLHGEDLAHCCEHVVEAGCSVKPTFARGATLLVPFTKVQLGHCGAARPTEASNCGAAQPTVASTGVDLEWWQYW